MGFIVKCYINISSKKVHIVIYPLPIVYCLYACENVYYCERTSINDEKSY